MILFSKRNFYWLFIFISFSACELKNRIEDTDDLKPYYGNWKTRLGTQEVNFSIKKDSMIYRINENIEYKFSYSYKNIRDSILIYPDSGFVDYFSINKLDSGFYFCNYKNWFEENRIDEIILFSKDVNTTFLSEVTKDVIVIPEGKKGMFIIVFNQNEGQETKFDSEGNRQFFFEEESNILFVKAKENPKKMATNSVVFFEGKESNYTSIPIIHETDLSNLDLEEKIVVNCGFNQINRNVINKITDKNILGNVAYFKVGYYPTPLNRNDSILYKSKYWNR